jgi:two-component sensor histidine kinase/CheY-like chemotaxis protein
MKVMMVDDSAAERKLCRLLLEEAHGPQLEFFEADTAAGGLETVRAKAPDCILLDYRLPDMTGLDFLAKLSDWPEVTSAVVMLTGVTSEEVAVEAMKAGAQDYLVKDRITSGSLSMAIQKATQKVGLMHALEAERDRLARSLAEKEVLLQEVHHRVKNNLQVIASLLRLQADGFEGQPAEEALRESQYRVESMALIHEQLYESGDLRQVDLAEHAGLLMNNLLHAYGVEPSRISGQVMMEPLVLGVDQAIPAGLILNELMSNALKHAFPGGGGGQLAVAGGLAEGRVELTVWNNGAELPANFAPSKTSSLGLRIVQILARQLKGTFEFERGAGNAAERKARGTMFRVSFPRQPETPGGYDASC